MKVILGSKKRHYAVGVSIFLITAALLWAMMGCTTPLEEYKLTISSTEGGSVTDPGEGTFFLSKGMSVLLEVQPDDGYRLVGWAGDWDRIKKVGSTLIVIRDDYSITAEFKKIEKCCLTVSAPVGGGVTVTSLLTGLAMSATLRMLTRLAPRSRWMVTTP